MYCEIPIFKRCCFCLPLRQGLIAHGYIKAIMMIYNTCSFGVNAWREIMHYPELALVLLVMLLDVAATCVFIIGGHFKKPGLLKFFMWYNIVITIIYVIVMVTAMAINHYLPNLHIIVNVTLGLVVQTYVIFLIRSQVYKLQNPEDEVVEYKSGYAQVIIEQPQKDAITLHRV